MCLMCEFFFFSVTATSYIYTLSLHDALPICPDLEGKPALVCHRRTLLDQFLGNLLEIDRKSTRLNSSHRCISYAVFCLKKKKNITSLISNTCQPSLRMSPLSLWMTIPLRIFT